MKKSNLLFLLAFLPFLSWAQPVQFNYSNKATVSVNLTDTLKYPFIGGLNAPQFNKIDLDGDGVKDLFVFDRVGSKAMTYLFKNGTYVYAPFYESMFPPLYKWVLMYDYNKDGKEDIFTEVDYNAQPEPDKYVSSNGVRLLRNVTTVPGKLKWKQDLNQLMDTGLEMLPPSNIALSNTDYSAFHDIDGDGDMDILLMQFGKNVITYYQNLSQEMGYGNDSLKFVFRDECWGYMSYLVNKNGFLLNDDSPCFRNYKTAKHNGTTLTVFDSDNDGDMDLIYGDVGFQSLVYLKNGKTIMSLKRDSIIAQDTAFPSNSVQAKIEIFPASFIVDIDEDGKKDLIVAPNAEAAAKNNEQVMYYRNTGTSAVPTFTYQSTNFLVGDMLDLGGGSIPRLVDIDADGDLDLIIATQGEYTVTANSNDKLVLFKNVGTKTKAKFVLENSDFLMINSATPKIQRVIPSFGDLNGDSLPDMIIGDLNGKLHYYENASLGGNIVFNKISNNYFNMFAGTSAAPCLVDLNKDGKTDIVVGRKNGTLVYFENTGTELAAQFAATASIDSIGKVAVGEKIISAGMPYYFDGYSVPEVCDLDKDGNYEVLVGSDQGRVFLYRNFDASASRTCMEIENVFSDAATVSGSNLFFGPKTSVATGDLDGDGVSELVIGNMRGGIRMYSADIKGVISGVKEERLQAPNCVLFPNPAKDILQIRSDKNLKDSPYTISDILGHSVQTGTLQGYENSIDTRGLTPGFYFFQSSDGIGNQYVAKFLIE
ncbi:MAG: hypothetical protein CFE21_15475 [Bacteroidetes bacterium B1(2017)]|nr:MAG: hypothetical protein CFE21_15475 [Bacteroidetes bacterium B1(2017)]